MIGFDFARETYQTTVLTKANSIADSSFNDKIWRRIIKPRKNLAEIFNKFFTTKCKHRGMSMNQIDLADEVISNQRMYFLKAVTFLIEIRKHFAVN